MSKCKLLLKYLLNPTSSTLKLGFSMCDGECLSVKSKGKPAKIIKIMHIINGKIPLEPEIERIRGPIAKLIVIMEL